MLGPGDFFGEGGLAGLSVRKTTATALTPTTTLVIGKAEMIRVLRAEHTLSDRFIAYMLGRNIRIEEDLLDQLFDSTEKGLARALLLRAHYGTKDKPDRILGKISAAALASMVGSTPARISAVLEKFTRLGFVHEDPAGLAINFAERPRLKAGPLGACGLGGSVICHLRRPPNWAVTMCLYPVGTRGVQPFINCAARSAETTTNSNAFVP
jgi:hypothetical protein